MPSGDYLRQFWHVATNDEVGGWNVTNYDVKYTSQLRPELGHRSVAECLSEEVAKHIVRLHNEYRHEIDRQHTRFLTLHDDLAISIIRDDTKFAVHQAVAREQPIEAYIHTVKEMTEQFFDQLRKEGLGG
jgi:hypothetical protein